MTNPTPHGQVPEALRLAHIFDKPLPPEWPDMVAAAAELRRQHARIAELEAQIEALSGVQALSAAPEAKKSALRTYPNPIVPLIKPVSEQEKMRALYLASSNLMAYLGRNGAIHSDGHAADAMMDCLNDLDGGGFDETLFAASPTHPAEQAAPKAAPGEQNTVPAEWLEQAYREGWAACRDAETIGEEAEDWAFGNSTANSRMIDAQQAAPKQEVQEPVAWYEYNADLDAWFLAYRRNPKAKTRPLVFGDTTPQPAPAPLSDDVVRDAARYRWLRATTNYVTSNGKRIDVRNMPEKWDAAIDAAIAAQGGSDAK